MELADFIELGKSPPPLDFLVIGGWAVAVHGHTRSTFDVDFLIRRSERDLWKARLEGKGFQVQAEANTFVQFVPPSDTPPFDVMLVDDRTFAHFLSAAVEKDWNGKRALAPSLDHLIALKLHVLKQGLVHRTYKDAEDVEMLARRNKLDLSSPHYQELFLKYGTREIYETMLRVLRH